MSFSFGTKKKFRKKSKSFLKPSPKSRAVKLELTFSSKKQRADFVKLFPELVWIDDEVADGGSMLEVLLAKSLNPPPEIQILDSEKV